MTNDQQLTTSGWDIGGANLKAVRLNGNEPQISQRPFAIWQRRDDLIETLGRMSAELGPTDQAAITITAELSDAFRTKREGVTFVLDAVRTALSGSNLHLFGVDGQFHPIDEAYEQPLLFAAANWLATGLLAAQHWPNCLLVDIGSTTTDITPIVNGQVAAQGRTDPDRLLRGELLYSGALRTPVFAVIQRAPLWGGWCPVAAELFATMQDVYLWLERLAPEQATSPTADGRPIALEFCAERLARVVCADAETLATDDITTLAHFAAQAQLRQISAAMAQVLSARPLDGPVVGVGVGAFLAENAAQQLGLSFFQPADLFSKQGLDVAPAAAVATLLAQQTVDA